MAWQFGTPTNNRIQLSCIGVGATIRTGLNAGWFYPQTLTAGKTYWSQGSFCSARIATTTSEMTLHTDNTTDGVWTTSGAGIVTNEWQFLAFMNSSLNGTPSSAWRVWKGTTNTPPTEISVSVTTAPVGNFTAGTTITIGQLSGGTVAFEGVLGSFFHMAKEGTVNAGSSLKGPLPTAAYGAITQEEADLAYQRYVIPLWLGNKFPDDVWNQTMDGLATQYICGFIPTDQAQPTTASGRTVRLICQLNNDPQTLVTIAGAPVYSQLREPRSWNQEQNIKRGFLRR